MKGSSLQQNLALAGRNGDLDVQGTTGDPEVHKDGLGEDKREVGNDILYGTGAPSPVAGVTTGDPRRRNLSLLLNTHLLLQVLCYSTE